MPFKNATLAQNDHIPSGIIAAITSAQYEHHPFKDGSASLADLMRVMHNIRALSSAEYNACVRAVLDTVMNVADDGCNCYGRGLVFLRHITVDLDRTLYTVGTKLLEAAIHVCPSCDAADQREAPAFEAQFLHRLEVLRISPVDQYEWVAPPEPS